MVVDVSKGKIWNCHRVFDSGSCSQTETERELQSEHKMVLSGPFWAFLALRKHLRWVFQGANQSLSLDWFMLVHLSARCDKTPTAWTADRGPDLLSHHSTVLQEEVDRVEDIPSIVWLKASKQWCLVAVPPPNFG